MVKNLSYDITLDTDEYILARDASGTPRIQLGSTPSEPGFKSQIGTIRIDSFEDGVDYLIDNFNKGYLSSDCTVKYKNQLMPFGNLGGSPTTLTGAYSATVSTNLKFGAFILHSDTVMILITPLIIYTFTLGGVTTTSRLTATADKYFTGSYAKHGDYYYFGQADIATHESVASGRWQISTGVTGTWDKTGPIASYMYSFGNKIWYVVNKATGTPHEIYWTDSSTGTLTPLRGPFYIRSNSKCTGLSAIGAYTIYFMDDGSFNAIDTEGVFAPLTLDEYAPLIGTDIYFGHPVERFMGGLLIPHADGFLYLQDIDQYANFSLPYGTLNPSGVHTFDAIGDEIYMVNRYRNDQAINLYYMNFSQSTEVIHMLGNDCWGTSMASVPAIKLWRNPTNGELFLYFVSLNTSATPTLNMIEVSQNLKPRSNADDAFATSHYIGDSRNTPFADHVTKRFIRVRGVQANGNYSTNYITPSFRLIPSGSYTSLGAITNTSAGNWSVSFPNTSAALGRGVGLHFSWFAADAAGTAPYLYLPIFIDFEYVPSENDIITLPIVAAIDEYKGNNARRKKHTIENVMTTIQGLIGSIVTLKIMEGNQTWTVLVEDYKMRQTMDELVINQGEAVIDITCRRLA